MFLRLRALACALTTVTATVVISASPAAAAGATLTVNVAQPFRPVTDAASGGLYGLAENSRPADSTLLPLKVNSLTQPAPGVGQKPNGQPAGGDSLLVAPQATRVGAGEFIRMPDIYPDFPYRWVSWNDWLAKVDTMVNARRRPPPRQRLGWELWNEPDWTWDTAAAGCLQRRLDAHLPRRAAPSMRHDPDRGTESPATTAAPGCSPSSTNAEDNATLPDIIAWHELETPRSPGDIAKIAASRPPRDQPAPIAIKEYAPPTEVGVPGRWSAMSPSSSAAAWTTPSSPSGTSTARSERPGRQRRTSPPASGGCTSGTATWPGTW